MEIFSSLVAYSFSFRAFFACFDSFLRKSSSESEGGSDDDRARLPALPASPGFPPPFSGRGEGGGDGEAARGRGTGLGFAAAIC